MPQFPNLKLLLLSSPIPFLPSRLSRAPFSRFSVHSHSPRKPGPIRRGTNIPQRRRTSTLRENREPSGGAQMEGPAGFNKRRAEGRDKPNQPRVLERKVRKVNPVNTICYVQILGTGMDTQDTLPSVLLFFDKQRFIFNAGEGLQRYCTEHKIKLSKIDHMFLTRVCSETAGGLPGLLLTLAGIGEEGMSVNIWGPSDIKYLVDAMRSFIPNAAMVHTHSFGSVQDVEGAEFSRNKPNDLWEPIALIDDEVVRVSAILLKPSYSGVLGGDLNDSSKSNLASSSMEESSNQFPIMSDSCIQDKTEAVLKPGDIAVIYACELPEIRGTFDPKAAADLGLKPGPKYRELQLGNPVMSDTNNKLVYPSQVLGESSPGPIVLLVDCPTAFHMTELLSIQSLNCYYEDSVYQPPEGCKVVNCIIHLGPSSVTKSVDYQKWMKRFGNSTKHIMAGHEIKNMEIPILKSSARISSRLHYLCPQLFPAPGVCSGSNFHNISLSSDRSFEEPSPSLCDTISAENLLKFHLRPKAQLGLDRSLIPSLSNHKDIVNELLSEIPEVADIAKCLAGIWPSSLEGELLPTINDNVVMVEEPWINGNSCIPSGNMESLERDACKVDLPICLENITREDMEVVLLGTGSSQPSKYRNVSSVFVNLFSKGSLLLDCGEGTLGQLKRRYGVKGADDALKGLRCIWISHIHADHHTGLARILALRCQLLKGVPHEPITVVGPRQLKRFLDAYARVEDLDMQFVDCNYTTEASLTDMFSSQDASNDCHLEPGDKEVKYVEKEAVTSQHLGSTLFAPGTRMQSVWKSPRTPLSTSNSLPVLVRLKEVLAEAGLEVLYSVPVIHCPQAFGIVLKASERINSTGKVIPGWKLVYSGDTRPCQALIDASRDATILIHEATFEDGLEDEAIARNHSTTMEAINVGESAGAYRIILTHFSQRYPKIPVFNEAHMDQTCIGFDLMSVNLADLPVLPKVLPYLRVLFKNEMVADEFDEELGSAVNQ